MRGNTIPNNIPTRKCESTQMCLVPVGLIISFSPSPRIHNLEIHLFLNLNQAITVPTFSPVNLCKCLHFHCKINKVPTLSYCRKSIWEGKPYTPIHTTGFEMSYAAAFSY
ncbi:hypothetical protein COMA2_10257 [Candidatus Nitrospira nitrificans]|uniref:Uncharacterized protein n=1 Tax=Candidatus Nitrospira nitrificans TaxID=1742973 RepID=A0A0S4L4K6_9BACT|nr:hypothetical protein COMA2_10257 [Candidatus Nitrospira nitrificans]